MPQSRFGSEFGNSDDSWSFDSDESGIRYCTDEEFNEQEDDSAFDVGDDNQEANESAFILDSVNENLDLDFAFDNNKAKGDKKRKAEEPLFSGRKGKGRKGKMKDHVAFVTKGRWGKGRWNKGQGKDDVALDLDKGKGKDKGGSVEKGKGQEKGAESVALEKGKGKDT